MPTQRQIASHMGWTGNGNLGQPRLNNYARMCVLALCKKGLLEAIVLGKTQVIRFPRRAESHNA